MIRANQIFPNKVRNAVVLDIGTSKICALYGNLSKDGMSIEVLSHVIVASKSISKGMIKDLKHFSEDISQVIAALEQKTNTRIKAVFVSIGGPFLEGCEGCGLLPLGDKPKQVTANHLRLVIEYARSVYVSVDKDIIHTVVSDYIVDNQEGVRNPIGLYGRKFEARVHFITARKSAIYNLINGFSAAGIEVEGFICGAYASGMGVLSQEERDKGAAVIDIGEGLCELAIFHNGLLKVFCGYEINVSKENPDKTQYYRCVENIFHSLKGHIDEFNYTDGIIEKIVLTGGGALDEGIFEVAQQLLPIYSEVGVARGFSVDSELLANPSFSSALGMLRYVFTGMHKQEVISEAPVKDGLFQKVLSWTKDIYEEYF